MTHPSQGHGAVVSGHNQTRPVSPIHKIAVNISVSVHAGNLSLQASPQRIHAHHLFVQVIEASPGRAQPVLEYGHILNMLVLQVLRVHGVNRPLGPHAVLGHA